MTCLIIRFGSIGNVAMSVPIITSLSRNYPQDNFVVVSKHRLSPLFYGLPNVQCYEADLGRGAKSILQVYWELRAYSIDAVFDLQDTLRSWVLRMLFRLNGKSVYVIDYGRAEKRHVVVRGYKHSTPLKTEFQRYAATFDLAGLRTDTAFKAIPVNECARQKVVERLGEKTGFWIGIAPFAKSKSNMLPPRIVKEVIGYYSQQESTKVFLFGAGRIECEVLRQWASLYPHVISVAGVLPMEEELELMRQLDVMVGMDSANQHLAALVGTRKVSIWCATHPMIGFAAWNQPETDRVQRNLSCRPCTVHGTKKCKYRNFACTDISAQQIIETVDNRNS